VAADRPAAPRAHPERHDRAMGAGAVRMTLLLGIWSSYVRLTARWPAIASIVPFLPVVAGWWAVTELEVFPRAFFPGPIEVVRSFGALLHKGILPDYLHDSVMRLTAGALVGTALGIPLGVLIGMSRSAHAALWPLLLFFQAIGDIAWLPILVIWFGYGLTTMTFVIVYTVLFPVVLNTVLGVRSIPTDLHHAALSLGASRPRIVWEVVLPGALPNIVTGLRNGLGYGWRALIAAEIIVGTSGIGFLMFDARRAGSVVEILVGMIILGALWYLVDGWILTPIERATGQRWGLVTR
jgi:taurine transport system permease protein